LTTCTEKQCSKCGEVKALELFYKDKRRKDGFSYLCKVCDLNRRTADYVADYAAKKAYYKSYKDANKERYKITKHLWYEANKEKVKSQSKAWYDANRKK